jgi:hypothetical protein
VPQQPIMLKVLLGQRHWQNYATFCAEYDKAARRIDSDLGQTFPSRAQGKDAVLFHHSVHSGQPTDIPFIEQAQTWFASRWETISYEVPA